MKKVFFLISIIAFSLSSFSQESILTPKKQIQKGFASLDYLSIKMPLDKDGKPEANMGFTGVHYNLWLNKTIYGGLGFYGTVNGKRGGLFTLGLNLGIKKKISDKIFIDTGIHLGAGGGAGAQDGGGAFLLPHFNIGYEFEHFSTTLGYSHVNFFDKGNINSQQFRIGFQLPLSFDFLNFKEKEKTFTVAKLKNSDWDQKSAKHSFLLHQNNYAIKGNSQDTKGNIYPKNTTIRVAGLEFTSYLKKNWMLYFKADGAFHGIDAGYMDIFIGGGYLFSFNKKRTIFSTKFAIGAGGGGGVDTQGGFLIQPEVSLEHKLFNSTFLYLNKGYILTPNSHFLTSTYGIGLKYYTNNQGIKNKNGDYFNSSKVKGVELIVGDEIYTQAQRRVSPTQQLHQFALQVNLYVFQNIYLAGSTSFASFGNAGAYAEGVVGFGYQTNSFFHNRVQLFGQILAGAAGGGDISTGQGLIIKPSLGINLKLNDKLCLRGSFGKVKARGGSLNSTSFNLGLNYRLGFLTAN